MMRKRISAFFMAFLNTALKNQCERTVITPFPLLQTLRKKGIITALRGKLFRKMNPLIRLLLAAGGLCMMFPDTLTDLVGLAVMVTACGFEYFGARNQRRSSRR